MKEYVNSNIKASILCQRQSNMELLRIIAMLLVLVVHSGWTSLGAPTAEDVTDNLFLTIYRNLIPSLSICCVNTFVMISGWFGMNFSFQKILKLLFQVYFFIILIDVGIIVFTNNYSIKEIIQNTFLLGEQYWFIKSYLMLMLLTPGLNLFIEKSTKQQLQCFLLLFYLFQTLYGWAFNGCGWFSMGYSPISFVGLYVLARYLRLYPLHIQNKSILLGIFIITVFITCIIVTILISFNHKNEALSLLFYNSPTTIIETVCLLLFFQKTQFTSQMINRISTSCLAVYLLHANELLLRPYYCKTIEHFYKSNDFAIYIIYTLLFIGFIFVISIIIDKARIYLWEKIC